MKATAMRVKAAWVLLSALAVAGCADGTTSALPSGAECHNTYIEEDISGDGPEFFNARFVVSSQSDQQVTGTLYVQRFEVTSFGVQPRVKGQAPVVLSVKTAVEGGGKIGSGSGTIGAFTNISGHDKSFTDFMWKVPSSTTVKKAFVQEDRIVLADLGPNFLAHDFKPNLFLRRGC